MGFFDIFSVLFGVFSVFIATLPQWGGCFFWEWGCILCSLTRRGPSEGYLEFSVSLGKGLVCWGVGSLAMVAVCGRALTVIGALDGGSDSFGMKVG